MKRFEPKKTCPIALVDVEGTLVRGDASLLALAELWSRGWRRGRLLAFLTGALVWHLLRRAGAAGRARGGRRR